MPVLVVHDSTNGHQQQDLKDHGCRTAQTTAESSLQRAFQIKLLFFVNGVGCMQATRTRLLTSTSSASIQPFTNTAMSSIASIIQNPLQAYRQYEVAVSCGFDDKSVSCEGFCTSSCECWRASSGARSSAITLSSPWRCVVMACQACCDGCEERRSRMDGYL